MQDEIKIEQVYPLLPAQRGFLVDSLAGEGDQYRQQICVEIKDAVSVETLVQRIHSLIKNNGLLRTIFDWSDDEPVQVVVSGSASTVNVLSGISDEALNDVLGREKDALRPISDAPPIRFTIIENNARLLLVVTYHHIILDGPSIGLLLSQAVSGNYIPEVSVDTYQEWFEENVGDTERAIWRDLLKDLNKQDGVLPGTISADGAKRHQVELDSVFYTRLLTRSKELHVTAATCMQTLWSEWALSYFNKESLLYGLVVSTRVPELSDQAMGPYISTAPWYIHKANANIDAAISETSTKLLDIMNAKHLPLGDITKYASPFAMSFDALLTITTHPVGDTLSYKVVKTYENTGYKLSVDIEISNNGVSVTFSTLIDQMDDALDSFVNYCKHQIGSIMKVEINQQRHHLPWSQVIERSNAVPAEDQKKIIDLLANSLNTSIENISPTSSFLEMGGDSIIALRLKSLLKREGLEISVGDILQTPSIQALMEKVNIFENQSIISKNVDIKSVEVARTLFGDAIEDVTYIPPSAQAITEAYRLGYGQDYHEQTAFRLEGAFRRKTLIEALDKLALEYPTLRLAYPGELPDMQVLISTPRTILKVKRPAKRSFDEFVHQVSEENWKRPFRIDQGPLLRVVASQEYESKWYLFISFSALITDGWSFSTMLERFFEIYNELLDGSYAQRRDNSYIRYSKTLPSRQVRNSLVSKSVDSNYLSEITGSDYVINASLTSKIIRKSKDSHRTVSDILVKLVDSTLADKDFLELRVYENGREDPELFTSVGPYSFLSSRVIDKSGRSYAYFVFENYPRESENRLKNGEIKYFNEDGNWRRDLLPPGVAMGYLFDVDKAVINVRILVRKSREESRPLAETYYNELINTLMKEE